MSLRQHTNGNAITVVCVYADYHEHLVERAAASVAAQTIDCNFAAMRDPNTGSPAYGRNRLVEQASTPFVLFLDADDQLYPSAAERMLAVWQPFHYVYGDAVVENELHVMPDDFPIENSTRLHYVTSLISREVFMQMGGFREGIVMEDSEFFFRAMASGICGIRCPFPIFKLGVEGQRANDARQNAQHDRILWSYYNRYKGDIAMPCCKGKAPKDLPPIGKETPDSVLVIANWEGSRTTTGKVTRTIYPRNGFYRKMWVHRADQAADPEMYWMVPRDVLEDVEFADVKENFRAIVNRTRGA